MIKQKKRYLTKLAFSNFKSLSRLFLYKKITIQNIIKFSINFDIADTGKKNTEKNNIVNKLSISQCLSTFYNLLNSL